MLTVIEHAFRNAPVKLRIASLFYDLGISIKGRRVFAGDFEIPVKVIADSLGVNRKTVYSFINDVESDYVLREVFGKLVPVRDLERVGPVLGYEVLVIKTDSLTSLKILDYLRHRVSFLEYSYSSSDGLFKVIYEPRLDVSDIKFISSLVGDVKLITPDVDKQRVVCEKCKVEYCPRRNRYV